VRKGNREKRRWCLVRLAGRPSNDSLVSRILEYESHRERGVVTGRTHPNNHEKRRIRDLYDITTAEALALLVYIQKGATHKEVVRYTS
jgi:hypothetical protein